MGTSPFLSFKVTFCHSYAIEDTITAQRIKTAILPGLSHLFRLTPLNSFLLLSDSISALHALLDPDNTSPLVQRILTLSTLSSMNSHIVFIWIPSHIGFANHDAVDLAAKQAPLLQELLTTFLSQNQTTNNTIAN